MSEALPFHKAVIEQIKDCASSSSGEGTYFLLKLLESTEITEGHDEIIEAVDTYLGKKSNGSMWGLVISTMKEAVLHQKNIHAKPPEEKPTISLDVLQEELEKALALLKDREPGLFAWNMLLNERLKTIHSILGLVF